MPLDNISELKRRVPGGKYVLTRAIAERARQLQEGAPPLTPVRVANPLSVAIDEIVEGKINFQIAEEEEKEEKPAETEATTSTDDILPIEPTAEAAGAEEVDAAQGATTAEGATTAAGATTAEGATTDEAENATGAA